jgi:hypothetical protein
LIEASCDEITFCSCNTQRTGAIHFIYMDWRHAEELLAAGRRAYSGLKNVCVWVKYNA